MIINRENGKAHFKYTEKKFTGKSQIKIHILYINNFQNG